MTSVRTLDADEWELWRRLRLRALADTPDAFMSTLAEEAAHPDEFWRDVVAATARHERGNLWVAEVDGEPAGMGFGRLDPDGETVHVFAMWVAPEARGKGAGRAVLEAILAWGGDAGATRADLWVTDGNHAALALYRRAGFEPTVDRGRLREGSELTTVRMEAVL